jgi:quinol monooxygenase YgiN
VEETGMAATVIRSRPDPTRPGVGVVKVSTWDVGSPQRQRAAVAAIEKAWRSRDWPDVGLLSYSVCTGEDGRTLLHYSQWRDEGAYRAFVARGRDERNAEIDAAVPGLRRDALHSYHLYRSRVTAGDDRPPGCVVVVDVDFEGPDPARARQWVDAVLAASEAEPEGGDGALSAHFHVSTDGARALTYAEWTDAAAHLAMRNGPGDGDAGPSPRWRRVHAFPGLRGSRVRRYTPALSLAADVQRRPVTDGSAAPAGRGHCSGRRTRR